MDLALQDFIVHQGPPLLFLVQQECFSQNPVDHIPVLKSVTVSFVGLVFSVTLEVFTLVLARAGTFVRPLYKLLKIHAHLARHVAHVLMSTHVPREHISHLNTNFLQTVA